MFCRKCGAEIDVGHKFCMECGEPVNYSNDIKNSVDLQHPGRNQTKGKYKRKKKMSIPQKIAIAVVAFFALVLLIPTPSEDKSDIPASTPSIKAVETTPTSLETQIESTVTVEPTPIDIAKKLAELEYPKYLENMEESSFMKKAMDNNISLNALYRQPDLHEGKEVYFGGTVLQALYDEANPNEVGLRIRENNDTSENNFFYATYTLKAGETRILEGDYLDLYGYSRGLVTYESVLGSDITLPAVSAKYVYAYADGTGLADTPALKRAKALSAGSFTSEDGKTISFPIESDPYDCYLYNATEYDEGLVVYYRPSDGFDSSSPHPFYRLAFLDDESVVVFRPNDDSEEFLYAIEDGTYTFYTRSSSGNANPAPETTATVADQQKPIVGYVLQSSGGLNVRTGPGIEYAQIARLEPNARVEIYEQQNVGDSVWGHIGQGWVCMDYIVDHYQSAASTQTPQSIIDQYSGRWGDYVGQRCMMNISYSNEQFSIEISWGNSAFSTTIWNFTGTYSDLDNAIAYSNGICSLAETNENGIYSETICYSDGQGKLYISNGNLYWDDYTEDAGDPCIFEKFE